MKADSASHLIRQPVNFEFFLFVYLVCALLLQKVNIYKTVSVLFVWCSLIGLQISNRTAPPNLDEIGGGERMICLL